MEMSTALALDKLPKCQACTNNLAGEFYCDDEKCKNTKQYYCETCQDPDLGKHAHANFKTIRIMMKLNNGWSDLIPECVKLQQDVSNLFKPKENLIRFLDSILS